MIVSGRRKLAKMVTTVAVEEVLVLQWHCSCRCCRRQAHLMLLDASAMSGSCRWRWRRRMLMVERRGGRRLAAVGGKVVVAAAMAPRAARSGWLHGAPGQISFAGPGRPSLGQIELRRVALFSINTYKNKQLLSIARADSPQSALRGVGFSRTYGGCGT